MSMLKKLFRNYFLLSLVCILLGIALIVNPEFFTHAISYTIGGLSVGVGAISIIRYVTKGEDKDEYVSNLLRGIVLSIIGIFLIAKPDFIFKVIAFAFGFYMLFSGIVSLMNSMDIKRADGNWVPPCVFASITAVLGLIILLNPLAPFKIAVRILGIALLVSGITNMSGSLSGNRQLKNIEKNIKKSLKSKSDKDDFIDIE